MLRDARTRLINEALGKDSFVLTLAGICLRQCLDVDVRSPPCEGSISLRWSGMTNDVYRTQQLGNKAENQLAHQFSSGSSSTHARY